jgi:hypothetical protein
VKGGRWLGVVGAGVAGLAIAGAAVALPAGSGGAGGKDDDPTGGKPGPSTSEPAPATSDVPKPDRLCVAHEARAAAISALGTVDSPADREAVVLAELTFYSDAAGNEPEPDATAFRMLAQYFDALRVFYEPRGWANADLTEIAEVPRPPTGDWATRTSEILAERCGVAAPTDTPVEVTP